MSRERPLVRDAMAALDTIAPPHLAFDDDPRGLLLGDLDAPLRGGIVVALDATLPVIDVAVTRDAGMVITHHPLIYRPLKRVRADEAHPGASVLRCARHEIAVACAHTNWDVAPGGINDVLADRLGLKATRPVRITYREPLLSLAVFVAASHRAAMLDALAEVGAGRIGDYDRCAFWTDGVGTFRPLAGAQPFVGTVGTPERVAEERLEMVLPASCQAAVVAALRAAHPYEEPAYFIHALANSYGSWGIGRVGALPIPLPAADFHQMVKDTLGFPEVRLVAADPTRLIRTVAVCGGAGAELMTEALESGADALVTADIRHHEFIDGLARDIVLLDAGHAQTETPGTEELARRLGAALAGHRISVTFLA